MQHEVKGRLITEENAGEITRRLSRLNCYIVAPKKQWPHLEWLSIFKILDSIGSQTEIIEHLT